MSEKQIDTENIVNELEEGQKNSTEGLNTSNIFDDFDVENEAIEEKSEEKDMVYYLNILGKILKYLNIILFFMLIVVFSYIYVQKADSQFFNNKDYLDPVCTILAGENRIYEDNCSSIHFLNQSIDKKIEQIKKDEFKAVIDLLKNNFELYNVSNSNEALFILDKSKNKNIPLEIMSEFDLLKNNFTGYETSKIKCYNIDFKDNILSLKCSAFSRGWEEVPGLEGAKSLNTLEGSSRTLAISFMNFLEKSDNFSLLDKQKTFSIIPFLGEGAYVYKTDFKLKLKYNRDNNNNLY